MHEFEFQIKQKVRIKQLECEGKVVAIYICETGVRYEVRYFIKAEAKNVYFYADELERTKENA
jgi:hypothetical protein